MSRLELSTCQLTGIDENGFIGAQIDALGGQDSGVTPDQLSHTHGFKSRPLDPVDGIGCSMFHYQCGSSERYCWLADDPRSVEITPPIKKGGSCQYASDGSFASFDPETHTWTLYVPYATGPAKAHLVTVGRDGNDTPIVELASGEGPSITILDQVTTLKNADGSAYVVLDGSGTSVVGPFKAAGGADIGGPSSVPLTKHPAVTVALTPLIAALGTLAGLPPLAAAAAQLTAAAAALTVLATPVGGTVTTKGA
jgi:hypothetical protein